MMFIMRHWDTVHDRFVFLYVKGIFVCALFLCLYFDVQKVDTLHHVNAKCYLYIMY